MKEFAKKFDAFYKKHEALVCIGGCFISLLICRALGLFG